jgi:hypothetical protein
MAASTFFNYSPFGDTDAKCIRRFSGNFSFCALICFCTEDGSEFTFKTLFCHNGTPIFKVSKRGAQHVDY